MSLKCQLIAAVGGGYVLRRLVGGRWGFQRYVFPRFRSRGLSWSVGCAHTVEHGMRLDWTQLSAV